LGQVGVRPKHCSIPAPASEPTNLFASNTGKKEGIKMIDGTTEAREHDSVAEMRLWQAVIVSTIREWTSGPLRRKLEAERYLFSESSDFALVCQSAGISVGRLRGQLGRLKRQTAIA
jgi:hypothetical protein